MSREPIPLLLMLAMSLPSTVTALGLGDLHVDSALNEPLAARIDIVGATPQELLDLRAAIANREIFQRYNADRPAFLNSTTLKVGRDAMGRPVLVVTSHDAFTDPLVSLLVDMRWPHGDVVREYSLLLDPPNFRAMDDASRLAAAPPNTSETSAPSTAVSAGVAASASPGPAPLVSSKHAAVASTEPTAAAADTSFPSSGAGRHYRVAARDTLRGIARRSGARSEVEAQRLMIATFRANPQAFEGNINLLHRGAELTLPAPDAVAAVSAADARREVREHMSTWRLNGRPAAPRTLLAASAGTAGSAATATPAATAPTAALAPAAPDAAAPGAASAPAASPVAATASAATAATAGAATSSPATEILKGRVQTLEQSLNDMKRILASEDAKMLGLQHQVSRAAAGEDAGAAHAVAATAATLVPAAAAAERDAGRGAGRAHSVAPVSMLADKIKGGVELAAAAAGSLLLGFALFRYRRLRVLAKPKGLPDDTESLPAVQDTSLITQPVQMLAAAPPAPARPAPGAGAASRPYVTAASQGAAPTPVVPADDTVRMGSDTRELDILSADTFDPDALGAATSGADTLEQSIFDPDALDADPYGIDIAATQKLRPQAATVSSIAVDTAALAGSDLDFDLGATGEHVQMPSGLHDHVVVAESRTNIIEVLKSAIERDPQRRDLRLKLLEVYYSAAATNQRAFLDIAAKMAQERKQLSAEEWDKIVRMGREIAAGSSLFEGSGDYG